MSAVEVNGDVIEFFDKCYDEYFLSLFDGTIIAQNDGKVKFRFYSCSPNNISS